MPLARPERPFQTIVDRLTPIVVREAFSDEALAAAQETVAAGRVSRPSLGPTKADAAVADGGRVLRVRLFWSGESLGASCDCGKRCCAHSAYHIDVRPTRLFYGSPRRRYSRCHREFRRGCRG